MNKLKSQLAQIISSKICNQLTSHMDYKAYKYKLQNQRDFRAVQNALSYTQVTVEKLRQLQNIKPQQIVVQQLKKADRIQRSQCFGMGRRVSIMKIKRINSNSQTKRESLNKSNKKLNRFKQVQKGLIKLCCQQNQLPSFTQYIDKLRQKKIKLAQVMEQMNKDRYQKQNLKQIKTKKRQTNHVDKAFITTFTGELIKCEKKEQNSKRDEIYLQKIKIKPIYKLREHVSSRVDVYRSGETGMQTKRASISKQVRDSQGNVVKDQNHYIKSVLQVLTNRKQLQNIRRRRNNLQ